MRERWWIGVLIPVAVMIAALGVAMRGRAPKLPSVDAIAPPASAPAAALAVGEAPSLSHTTSRSEADALEQPDLARLTVARKEVRAPVEGGKWAHLTLDPRLQTATSAILSRYAIPEASAVVVDVESGEVLAYASHVERGERRDLAVEARAPAASVFKVVTSAALVERAHLGPDESICYSGGEQRITRAELTPDPARDRTCGTLGQALGRSANTVFARLATKHLDRDSLTIVARKLGFGAPLPFDVPVAASSLHVPDDELGFARTAAGFWNTTLSPVHAAHLAATIARAGRPPRMHLVRSIDGESPRAAAARAADHAREPERVLSESVAGAVARMMEHTVAEGTSHKSFHDNHGQSFLGAVHVAGKTGTLTDHAEQRYYTWFMGFAPSRPVPGVRQVAVAALVVNGPVWKVKASFVAREVLRAHFAQEHVAHVTPPVVAAVESEREADGAEARSARSPSRRRRPSR